MMWLSNRGLLDNNIQHLSVRGLLESGATTIIEPLNPGILKPATLRIQIRGTVVNANRYALSRKTS